VGTMRASFNVKKLSKTVTGVVDYSLGFVDGAKLNERKLSDGVAELSIDAFYDYMDGLARSHPGMLHHVYEWGQVGSPAARLFQLKKEFSARNVAISAEFLQSTSISETSNEPFYNKAEIMEEGIPVVINEVNAKALFFTIEGQEFFRVGPIVIANPGGSATRGSFVNAFNEFYGIYFEEVFLRSIRFYDKLRNPKEYSKSIKAASKSQNSYNLGKRAALSWIQGAVK
jgi:hypothetical protein